MKEQDARTPREIREALGLTTKFVAAQLNINSHNYTRRERGEVEWTAKELKAFSMLTGVPVEQIAI